MICNLCGEEVENKKAGAHKRWCRPEAKGLTMKDKVLVNKTCEKCGVDFETLASPPALWHYKSARKGKRYCSSTCQTSSTMTKEVREKISKSRSKYLRDNPDKHPWKDPEKFNSAPCLHLQKILRENNFTFETEWNPINSNSYAIDIAFPDIKVGIEVNGNQHYKRCGNLKDYYKKRHEKIVKEGWVLIEMHYANVYKNKEVAKLLSYLKTESAHMITFTKVERKEKPKKKTNHAEIKRNKDLKRIEFLKTIDMQKIGWVKIVSEEFGVSHTQVKRIVKKLMPEQAYYERKSAKNKLN